MVELVLGWSVSERKASRVASLASWMSAPMPLTVLHEASATNAASAKAQATGWNRRERGDGLMGGLTDAMVSSS